MKNIPIYYPYYELEKDNLINKTNHLLNIKIFLLLADKVLIPPAHILGSSLKNILNLKKIKPFIDDGLVYTTIDKTNKTLSEYYKQKKEEDSNWDKYIESKAQKIIEAFDCSESTKCRDRKAQSSLYYESLNELILEKDDVNRFFSRKKLSLIDDQIKILLDKKGFRLSKSDFDSSINILKKEKKIDQKQSKILLDFSNSAYYYIGCLYNETNIGSSNYFQNIQISKLNSDVNFSPILFYNPTFFIHFLQKTGLTITEADILNLNIEDIQEIRLHNGFTKFKEFYQQFCLICQDSLENTITENFMKDKFNSKLNLFKNFISFSNFLSTAGLILTQSPFSVILYLLNLLEAHFRAYNFGKKFNAYTIDEIRVEITKRIAPLNSFLLNIEKTINKNLL